MGTQGVARCGAQTFSRCLPLAAFGPGLRRAGAPGRRRRTPARWSGWCPPERGLCLVDAHLYCPADRAAGRADMGSCRRARARGRRAVAKQRYSPWCSNGRVKTRGVRRIQGCEREPAVGDTLHAMSFTSRNHSAWRIGGHPGRHRLGWGRVREARNLPTASVVRVSPPRWHASRILGSTAARWNRATPAAGMACRHRSLAGNGLQALGICHRAALADGGIGFQRLGRRPRSRHGCHRRPAARHSRGRRPGYPR